MGNVRRRSKEGTASGNDTGTFEQHAVQLTIADPPKTLITHLVRWLAEFGRVGDAGPHVLEQMLATEISPDLLPGKVDKVIDQKTETITGG